MRRRTWWGLGALTLVIAGAAGYTAYRAHQVQDDLFAARDAALELKSALEVGDQARAESALDTLTERAAEARDGTSGPVWSLLGVAPWIGDDADGVRTVTQVLDDLAADGLRPLVDTAGGLGAGSFAPSGGRISVTAISDAAGPVDSAKGAFADADRRLSRLDADGYVSVLREAVDDLGEQVHDASYGLNAASRATDVLPQMLGADRPRRWLLIFQNPAELRSTGGLPGASSLLSADNGRIKMVEQYTSFPQTEKPVLPLTAEERDIYDEHLGIFYQDANFTPDFGRTADLMAAHLRLNEQVEVDGVLSLDPVALSYLLEGLGPVEVQGVTLTADNAVDELLHKTYLRIEDPVKQNEFFAEAARVIFERFAAGSGSPQKVLSALDRSARERRLWVHSFDDAEQAKIGDTLVAENLLEEADGEPRIGVYLNDGTGSKMSYFLDYDVAVRATGCRAGQQKYAGTFTLVSRTPKDPASLPVSITGGGFLGVPPGEQWVFARLYAPLGGEFDGILIDGEDQDVFFEKHAGHTVASLVLEFKPGERREVTFRMTGGPGQDGETEVYVTPGTQRENESSRLASRC